MTTPTPRTDELLRKIDALRAIRGWIDGVDIDRCAELLRMLERDLAAAQEARHAASARAEVLQEAMNQMGAAMREARQLAEAAERERESVKAENSKLRSALEIVHFKREPWQ